MVTVNGKWLTDYMKAREIWWNRKDFLSHIEVVDKKPVKEKSKGFQ